MKFDKFVKKKWQIPRTIFLKLFLKFLDALVERINDGICLFLFKGSEGTRKIIIKKRTCWNAYRQCLSFFLHSYITLRQGWDCLALSHEVFFVYHRSKVREKCSKVRIRASNWLRTEVATSLVTTMHQTHPFSDFLHYLFLTNWLVCSSRFETENFRDFSQEKIETLMHAKPENRLGKKAERIFDWINFRKKSLQISLRVKNILLD